MTLDFSATERNLLAACTADAEKFRQHGTGRLAARIAMRTDRGATATVNAETHDLLVGWGRVLGAMHSRVAAMFVRAHHRIMAAPAPVSMDHADAFLSEPCRCTDFNVHCERLYALLDDAVNQPVRVLDAFFFEGV